MSWPEERKLVELERKLSSIDLEFRHWMDETSAEGPLPKHNSQVRRITRQLGAFTESLGTWLQELKQDRDRLLRESRSVESMILDVHRIWEFFRSKLAQRYVEWFRDFLVAADEYAWASYDAARAAVDPMVVPAERIKEPPLVFLNGGWSPFAMSRGVRYEAEWVPDEDITAQQFRQILQDLPLPVIGMPWYQIRHVPDAVAIGHEVGHSVEDDFGLTPHLGALLEAAMEDHSTPGERKKAWQAWRGELFADMYGILAAGPAFVSGLMDFLALSPKDIMSARQAAPGWLEHPPDALRVIFNLRALDLIGFPDQAAALRTAWTVRYPHHAMDDFDQDIEAVVRAFLKGPYPAFGGSALTDVISFGGAEWEQAKSVKRALRQGLAPAASIRPIVAGTRLAFEENPTAFVEKEADQIVLTTIRKAQTTAFRGEPEAKILDDLDADAGRVLFQHMKALRTTSSSRQSPSAL